MSVKYSERIPTEPGLYWIRSPGDRQSPCEIFMSMEGLLARFLDTEGCVVKIHGLGYRFSGRFVETYELKDFGDLSASNLKMAYLELTAKMQILRDELTQEREKGKYPNIGENPYNGNPGPQRRLLAAHERISAACALQQGCVPTQTALVWRADLSVMLDELNLLEGRITTRVNDCVTMKEQLKKRRKLIISVISKLGMVMELNDLEQSVLDAMLQEEADETST